MPGCSGWRCQHGCCCAGLSSASSLLHSTSYVAYCSPLCHPSLNSPPARRSQPRAHPRCAQSDAACAGGTRLSASARRPQGLRPPCQAAGPWPQLRALPPPNPSTAVANTNTMCSSTQHTRHPQQTAKHSTHTWPSPRWTASSPACGLRVGGGVGRVKRWVGVGWGLDREAHGWLPAPALERRRSMHAPLMLLTSVCHALHQIAFRLWVFSHLLLLLLLLLGFSLSLSRCCRCRRRRLASSRIGGRSVRGRALAAHRGVRLVASRHSGGLHLHSLPCCRRRCRCRTSVSLHGLAGRRSRRALGRALSRRRRLGGRLGRGLGRVGLASQHAQAAEDADHDVHAICSGGRVLGFSQKGAVREEPYPSTPTSADACVRLSTHPGAAAARGAAARPCRRPAPPRSRPAAP